MNNLKDHFGVTGAQLRTLVAEGLKGGGDWCDLFFEVSSYGELVLRDGVVSAGGSHIDYGCGVRRSAEGREARCAQCHR